MSKSKSKQDEVEIKIKYSDLRKPDFQRAMQKITNAELETKHAGHVHQIAKRINAVNKQIVEEFKEAILDKYAQKDDTGALKADPAQPGAFIFHEGTEDEAKKAIDAFGEREAVIDWKPLNPIALSGMKLSATEIDALGDLFSMDAGPGLPNNIHELMQQHGVEQ